MKKIVVWMLSSILLLGSFSSQVYAEETKNTDSCKIEQIQEKDSQNEKSKQSDDSKEIRDLKEKNELLKLGVPNEITLNQWYPDKIYKAPIKRSYKDKEKIDLSGLEIEFVKVIKNDKGEYEKLSEIISYEIFKEKYRGWIFTLKTEVAEISKAINGKMEIKFSFILKDMENSMK